jgi:hypothetical protein
VFVRGTKLELATVIVALWLFCAKDNCVLFSGYKRNIDKAKINRIIYFDKLDVDII